MGSKCRSSPATSKRGATAPGRATSAASAASAMPTSAPSTLFEPHNERDPRTPEPPGWYGRKKSLPSRCTCRSLRTSSFATAPIQGSEIAPRIRSGLTVRCRSMSGGRMLLSSPSPAEHARGEPLSNPTNASVGTFSSEDPLIFIDGTGHVNCNNSLLRPRLHISLCSTT